MTLACFRAAHVIVDDNEAVVVARSRAAVRFRDDSWSRYRMFNVTGKNAIIGLVRRRPSQTPKLPYHACMYCSSRAQMTGRSRSLQNQNDATGWYRNNSDVIVQPPVIQITLLFTSTCLFSVHLSSVRSNGFESSTNHASEEFHVVYTATWGNLRGEM